MLTDTDRIRNLLGRYCDLMDAGDFDGVGDLFADASMAAGDGPAFLTGATEVAAFFRNGTQVHGGTLGTKHLITNTRFDEPEIDGSVVARSSYLVLQAIDGLPLQPIIAGRYVDTFGRDAEDAWCFTERRFHVNLLGDLSRHLADPSIAEPGASLVSGPDESLRATLFGDVPLDAWPSGDEPGGAPWDGFVRARNHLAAGDQDLAVREWAAIETQAGFGAVESRHLLQAWHFLRSVGVQPDDSIAGVVLGVVVEVTVDDAHDVLAAYADGSVRYLNHAGGSTVVDAAPQEVAAAAAAVLAAGQQLAAQIGPWTEPQLPDLPVGHTRLTMLTRGGPRFGQGPGDVLGADPMAGPLLGAATGLLVAVVDL